MLRRRLTAFLEFPSMSHRPPLPRRWELYCVIAYLAPPVMLQFIPPDVVSYRDLVWLVTLVPAFLLSLQYGMRGAVAGLAMGTTLFLAVQFLAAWTLDPEDWRVTVPIYAAYGAVAISVGWLSQRLHLFYERAIRGERVAVTRQIAITIRHEVNNALAGVSAEAQVLDDSQRVPHVEDREAVRRIRGLTTRIGAAVEQFTRITEAPVTDYLPGIAMVAVAPPDLSAMAP
jgi:signal transduction histidine kinase